MAILMSADKKYRLNRMNSVARKYGLGDLLESVGVKKKGTFTTAGGDAAESIVDADVAAGDFVIVTINTEGASPVTIDAAVAAAGSITVTMSADPSTDHVLQYIVFEA